MAERYSIHDVDFFPYLIQSQIGYESMTLDWKFATTDFKPIPEEEFENAYQLYKKVIRWIPCCETNYGIQEYWHDWYYPAPNHQQAKFPNTVTETSELVNGVHQYTICRIEYRRPQIIRFGCNEELLLSTDPWPTKPAFGEERQNWGGTEFINYKTLQGIEAQDPESRTEGTVFLPEKEALEEFQNAYPNPRKAKFAMEYTLDDSEGKTRVRWRFTDSMGRTLSEKGSVEMEVPLCALRFGVKKEEDNQYQAIRSAIVYPYHARRPNTASLTFMKKNNEYQVPQEFPVEHRIEFDYDIEKSLLWWKYVNKDGGLLKKNMVAKIRANLHSVLYTILSYDDNWRGNILVYGSKELKT